MSNVAPTQELSGETLRRNIKTHLTTKLRKKLFVTSVRFDLKEKRLKKGCHGLNVDEGDSQSLVTNRVRKGRNGKILCLIPLHLRS